MSSSGGDRNVHYDEQNMGEDQTDRNAREAAKIRYKTRSLSRPKAAASSPTGQNPPFRSYSTSPGLARRMDGHPLFLEVSSRSSASPSGKSGYCISCPICDGQGCDWGKANETGDSTSISSLDSSDDDHDNDGGDETDECSSVSITDSSDDDEESEGASGRYDFVVDTGSEDSNSNSNPQNSDCEIGIHACVELTGVRKLSEGIESRSDPQIEEEDLDADETSQGEDERYSLGTSDNFDPYFDHERARNMEYENYQNTVLGGGSKTKDSNGIFVKANENVRSELAPSCVEETVTPIEIIKTDENGDVSGVLVVRVPSLFGSRSGSPNMQCLESACGSDERVVDAFSKETEVGVGEASNQKETNQSKSSIRSFRRDREAALHSSDTGEFRARTRPRSRAGSKKGAREKVRGHGGDDSQCQDQSDIRSMDTGMGNGLVRKSAVRRRGYAWRSKTFPKNAKLNLKPGSDAPSRKCSSLPQKGSSLDLAPSLLTIFDDKVASGVAPEPDSLSSAHNVTSRSGSDVIRNHRNDGHQYDDYGDDTALPHPSSSSSLFSSNERTAHAQNANFGSSRSTPSSSSLASNRSSSNVVYRSGKLPSLSQPLDRPVSLMDTDPAIRVESILDGGESKKRPLSISSMSSVSTSSSSLPRVRKKRGNFANPRSSDMRSGQGHGMKSNVIGEESVYGDHLHHHHNHHHHGGLPSGLVSESYSSMDSGCVESDRNGERCYDDNMSVTSSSGSASVRGDTTLGANASSSSLGMDTSETSLPMISLDRSDTSLNNSSSKVFNSFRSQSSADSSPVISKRMSGLSEQFNSRMSPDVVYPPSALTIDAPKQDSSFDEDSYVIRKMGSYINRNSAVLPMDFTGVHSSDNNTAPSSPAADADITGSSPDKDRKWGTSSRNKARERFFSNYEENYNKYASSPVDSESSFEAFSDTPNDKKRASIEPTSPSTPSVSSASPNTQDTNNNDRDAIDQVFRAACSPTLQSAPPSSYIGEGSLPGKSQPKSPPMSPSSASKYFDRRGSATSSQAPSSPSSSSLINKSASSRSSRKREPHDPQGGAPPTPAYVSYVQRVVMEIVETERSYLTSLEDIIFGYLEPLEHMLNMEAAKDDITCLFSNIRDIYNFNRCFLSDLETTETDPTKVAECFVKHNKGFVIYTEYCTNYPSAVEVLTRFMKHPELSQLCKDRQTALGHGLPLGAYLLRPVQRILKYHLLLQNIAKNYEKEKRDVPVLKQAFQHMTHMAHHINEMKRKHEHAVRIQEIQSQLEDYVGEDLTRLGDLVLESTFQVYGAKASRQVFLFERGLLISKKKEGGMLSCKTFIKCSNLMLVEVIPNEPQSFHAIPFDNPRAQYTLQARNMEQKRRWCQEIKRLILESFKGHIPDSVKNLVMGLGKEHDDDFVSKETLDAVRKHQHTAPEYLEKRRVRRKSGSRMPDFSLLRPQKAKRNGQRKNEKPVDSRRTESKSPELQRKAISKLILPLQSSFGSSLPNSPVSEPIQENLSKKSSYPFTSSTPLSNRSTPGRSSDSLFSSSKGPKISSSVSSSDISLIGNSKPSLQSSVDNKEKLGSDIDLVRRASSFRTAVRANPVVSVDLSNQFPVNGKENDKSMPKAKKGRRQCEWHKLSKSDMLDNSRPKSDRISGEDESSDEEGHDDYVLIKEDASCSPSEMQNSMDTIRGYDENSGVNKSDDELLGSGKTCNGISNHSGMHSRSSSLPALAHSVSNGTNVKPAPQSINQLQSTKDFQGSDNVRNIRVKGRLSRRDLQDAAVTNINGRYIKKKHMPSNEAEKDYVALSPQTKDKVMRSNSMKVESPTANKRVPAFHDSFARYATEKNAIHKASLQNVPNASSADFGSQDLRSLAYSRGVKAAKLTNWNSVDKLTKGSMNDLSHLHENPWEVNPQTFRGSSSQSFDNSTPVSRTKRGTTTPPENMHEKDNLDWLVYLKRNSLYSKSGEGSFGPKSNRKSTSVLDQGLHSKEISDLKRRISAQSPYATPPRNFMTIENMKRLGSSQFPEKNAQTDEKVKETSPVSPLASSEILSNATSDPIAIRSGSNKHPRCVSSSSLNEKRTMQMAPKRSRRPYSMEIDNKLTDESNKMVAEMEDYMSRTSSCDSVKSPNKFPTMLSAISIEEQDGEDANPHDTNNRLSVVSSVSTSSYESQASSSSDGLAGTLKSKLHNWASVMGRPSETYENIYQSPVLTDEEEEGKESQLASSPSPSKPKNTFVPPHPQRKVIQDQRGLQTVLREHSLGSASLGSRMANSVPIPVSPVSPKTEEKIFIQNDENVNTAGKHEENVDKDVKIPSQVKLKFSENISPEPSRYSLPATKEAVEALMPASLRDCDIQQSDSGFSIHSNSSNVSESTSPVHSPQSPMEKTCIKTVTASAMCKPSQRPQLSQEEGLRRQNSYESIDSTDSFYERRLSLALSTDGFDMTPMIVPVYDDEAPQGQVNAPPRKSIREYVQQIEEKFKPVAPQITEVRKRRPGSMIQQKLQSLKQNITHGRNIITGSRHASEEREFSRSKSQPPTQHRRPMKVHNKTPQSIDDINVSVGFTHHTTCQPKLSPARSRENVYLSKSENVYLSRSREYINLSPSKENLTNLDGKLSLPKMSYHSHGPGHESNWNSYQTEGNEDCEELEVRGQFVHKIKPEPSPSPLATKQDQFFSSSDEDEDVFADKPTDKVDQLSSEVDNLVIMKGWVKALVTKFQNK